MTKCWTTLVLLFTASCLASAQKPKPNKFLPPSESHGMTISGYGCDRLYVSDSTSTSKLTSYWKLLVWAQYGEKHKRYWQKSYDTYEIPVKNSVHSDGERVLTGEVIGGYELKSYDFTSLDKACAEWGAQVRSTLKIAPNGEKSNE